MGGGQELEEDRRVYTGEPIRYTRFDTGVPRLVELTDREIPAYSK